MGSGCATSRSHVFLSHRLVVETVWTSAIMLTLICGKILNTGDFFVKTMESARLTLSYVETSVPRIPSTVLKLSHVCPSDKSVMTDVQKTKLTVERPEGVTSYQNLAMGSVCLNLEVISTLDIDGYIVRLLRLVQMEKSHVTEHV